MTLRLPKRNWKPCALRNFSSLEDSLNAESSYGKISPKTACNSKALAKIGEIRSTKLASLQ